MRPQVTGAWHPLVEPIPSEVRPGHLDGRVAAISGTLVDHIEGSGGHVFRR
jgi:hypothetical protein